MTRFIVKVQLSVATSLPARQMLIYNRARTLEFEGDAPPEIVELMGDDNKAFFFAYRDARKRFVLDRRVDDQGW